MISISAFYVLCVLGAALAILLLAPHYQEIGDFVSSLFQDAKDAITESDNEGDEEQ